MCLILFSYMNHPDYKLVLASNRDEFYNRPTQPLDFWDDSSKILAGRDQQSRGTWLGVSDAGKIAAITNYRDPSTLKAQAPSRGVLVSGFLDSRLGPLDYLESIEGTAPSYNGFNLLVGDTRGLYYYSNMGRGIRALTPGTYGLSNAFLDTSWPKVDTGKREFDRIIHEGHGGFSERLFDVLMDTSLPADHTLPETGVGLAWERMLAPLFISSETYGTRSSALVLVDRQNQVTFIERTHVKKASGGFDHRTRTRKMSWKDVDAGAF